MREKAKIGSKPRTRSNHQASAHCLCGAVTIEIDVPARWAWHDHSSASRRAHGAAYATYVGSWKSRCRVTKGEEHISRFAEPASNHVRSFCAKCGTPLMYQRSHDSQMINIPRALFTSRTGREPLYHIAIGELQEWAYLGAKLVPLKGFPGVVWERTKRKKRVESDALFE